RAGYARSPCSWRAGRVTGHRPQLRSSCTASRSSSWPSASAWPSSTWSRGPIGSRTDPDLGLTTDGLHNPPPALDAGDRQLVQLSVSQKSGMTFGEFVVDKGLSLDRNEVPLSQEDLLGTLMTFSEVVIQGLKKMGVRLSTEDQEAYLRHWCCVGAS